MSKWVQKWPITGSSGNTYTVSQDADGGFGCSCPAWKFRRECCKHINEVEHYIIPATLTTDFRTATHALGEAAKKTLEAYLIEKTKLKNIDFSFLIIIPENPSLDISSKTIKDVMRLTLSEADCSETRRGKVGLTFIAIKQKTNPRRPLLSFVSSNTSGKFLYWSGWQDYAYNIMKIKALAYLKEMADAFIGEKNKGTHKFDKVLITDQNLNNQPAHILDLIKGLGSGQWRFPDLYALYDRNRKYEYNLYSIPRLPGKEITGNTLKGIHDRLVETLTADFDCFAAYYMAEAFSTANAPAN